MKIYRNVGITGNLYFTSKKKEELNKVCNLIGKSVNSIYYNKKFNMWVIRIKSKKHKKAADGILSITKKEKSLQK